MQAPAGPAPLSERRCSIMEWLKRRACHGAGSEAMRGMPRWKGDREPLPGCDGLGREPASAGVFGNA